MFSSLLFSSPNLFSINNQKKYNKMENLSGAEKPHVVCVPYPTQGHINPMMKLAKLLHSHGGFHVTFVHNEYNHARLVPRAHDSLPSFRFASIPDGLNTDPETDATQDIPSLCASVDRHCLAPFKELLTRLNDGASGGPRVTCIVADVAMPFTLEAAEEFGIKEVLLWTASACGFLGYAQYPALVKQGYTPLKDVSDLTNGHLDIPIDWIPSMKGIRLKNIPTFIRTTDPQDIMLNYLQLMLNRSRKAAAIIFNTFDALENDILIDLNPDFPPLYTVGPLHKLVERHVTDPETKSIPSNLWKEDEKCIKWLDSQEPSSVVYVNFGSITVMSNHQLVEFAFGLESSGNRFLWIIRPDLVTGDTPVLPPEFLAGIEGRGMLAEWCQQEKVLGHQAVSGFLTHSGWNSVMESVCSGVPMVSWPFFAEQQTNSWFSCNVWGIGMQIDNDVKREVVGKQVRELMDREKGKEMKRKALEWKNLAEEAVVKGTLNLENLIRQVLLSPEQTIMQTN